MNMAELVTYSKENGIAHIIIDNPPLNVMGSAVQQQIKKVFEQVQQDEEVVCAILTTAGNKAFMAGADIKEFPQLMDNPNMKEEVMEIHGMLHTVDQLPKPTIVVLDGLTLGGGCELALAFDIRIAEAHAFIGLPEVKLGLFPGGGGTQRLSRVVGAAKAKEMMYTGEPIAASDAEKIGLVNHVTPQGEGLNLAMKLAGQIANQSLQSLFRIKQAVDEGLEKNLQDGIDLEATLFTDVFQTEDVREGVDAFINKSKPVFKHK
ncbi:enoyl-CoA hydratase [Virgibacillus sp. SK37]|uniref:enoyl-CoA hydratase n=1 Tax=Virgibacillus sp. SK37 TaxID=403957 RepID=UPI00350F1FE9